MEREDTEMFRELLLEMRRRLAANVTHLQHDALEEGGDNDSELSHMPLEHLADRGSDTFARDLMLGMIQDNEAEIIDIDRALEKIDEGSYGVCEGCGEEIARQRLTALPFANLCIDCKQQEEQKSAGAAME